MPKEVSTEKPIEEDEKHASMRRINFKLLIPVLIFSLIILSLSIFYLYKSNTISYIFQYPQERNQGTESINTTNKNETSSSQNNNNIFINETDFEDEDNFVLETTSSGQPKEELYVTSISPQSDTLNVDPWTKVTVSFDKPIKQESVNRNTFSVYSLEGLVEGEYSLIDNNKSIIFTPISRLLSEKKYAVELVNIKSEDETAILKSNYKIYFTTAKVDIESDLLIYYPFDGNTKDASGNGNDATSFGVDLTIDRNGNNNNAAHFTGYNYIEVPAVKKMWDLPWTFSLWINISTEDEIIGGYGRRVVFSYAEPERLKCVLDSDCSYDYFPPWFSNFLGITSINVTDKNKRVFRIADATREIVDGKGVWQMWDMEVNPSEDKSSCLMDKGRWYYVTVVNDQTGVGVYCNTEFFDGLITANTKYRIDNRHSVNKYYLGFPKVSDRQDQFLGVIDDFRLYNRALNEYEVRELYNQ
ncbi:hypothetical protein A2X44_03170 [candidate division CPR3 bacterium GWF2_35_18]|uniref:Laminin G sub domain 2 n=1 Tax=candidate division CPR3 bacterium GW2011_GWF2_35_18 TaxID=1618350 RepID=A0A0G0E2Q8_UNCC3|nr:MAG: Laminin G sub domain 2 [candidate division CPR3 bacterium GW2011_GWF2_35_18]OGB62986.1 MAG: hypothetical protein A2X44_03170 [candidate division CPR3 bacterium GWF2_35_18]